MPKSPSPEPPCCVSTADNTLRAANTLDAVSRNGGLKVRVIQDISADEHRAIKGYTERMANTLNAVAQNGAFKVDIVRDSVGIGGGGGGGGGGGDATAANQVIGHGKLESWKTIPLFRWNAICCSNRMLAKAGQYFGLRRQTHAEHRPE